MASIVNAYRFGSLSLQLLPQQYPPHCNTRLFFKRASAYLKQRKKPRVAVLHLRGVIAADLQGGYLSSKKLNLESLDKSIDKTFATKGLKEVCLVVNSPGGSPVQSELIANRIMHLSKVKNVDVVSFVEDYGASGGYWLSCIGKEIYTAQNSIVGSIGVISKSFGLDKFIKNYDIDSRVIATGKHKDLWNMFQPERPEHRAILEKTMHKLFGNFTSFVKQRRGSRLKAEDDVLFTGEYWVGEDAVHLGLVDGVKTLSDYLYEKYGDDVNVVRINPMKSSRFGDMFNVSVPGVSISDLEHDLIHEKYKFL